MSFCTIHYHFSEQLFFLEKIFFWKLLIERLEMFMPSISHNIQMIDFLKIKVLNFNVTALTLYDGLPTHAEHNKHSL